MFIFIEKNHLVEHFISLPFPFYFSLLYFYLCCSTSYHSPPYPVLFVSHLFCNSYTFSYLFLFPVFFLFLLFLHFLFLTLHLHFHLHLLLLLFHLPTLLHISFSYPMIKEGPTEAQQRKPWGDPVLPSMILPMANSSNRFR